jgi:hypothetical protein
MSQFDPIYEKILLLIETAICFLIKKAQSSVK